MTQPIPNDLHHNQHADPRMSAASLDTQIRRANWAQLNGLAGTLTDDDFAAADAFSARVNQATDADMEARWGIQPPGLRQEIRALFDQPWTQELAR